MFYFLFVFVFLIIFFLLKSKNSPHTKPLVLFLVSYFVLICVTMMYLAKDTYYYNVVSNYFFLPKKLWLWMIFLKVDRIVLIRVLNWSSLGVVLFSVMFVLSFVRKNHPKFSRIVTWGIGIYAAVVVVLFDPSFYIRIYYFLYPGYLSPAAFISTQNIIQTVTSTLNALLLAGCIVSLLVYYMQLPRIRLIRANMLSITVFYTLIAGSYMLLFSFSPAYLIKVSKFAGTHTFMSIPLRDDVLVYNIFPYYLIITFALITYNVYRMSTFRNDLSTKTRVLTRQIDASETTSKAFCHFVKNELIAIQSEVEMLPVGGETRQSADHVVERCEALYKKLDELYKSTKTSELQLAEVSVQELVEETLAPFAGELAGYDVKLQMPELPLVALLDKEYFSQAIHNVIRNSLDAMAELDESRHSLAIRAETMDMWIVLEITDTGVGIARNNLDKIFNPFFSSHPFSKQWGIGLSLTYKIVTAHEGHIEVESERGVGTTMRVILPNVKKIYV